VISCPSRIRDSRVVDQQVETAKLLPDAFRRGGDRRPIGSVEFKGDGALSDLAAASPRSKLRDPTSLNARSQAAA